MVCYRVIDVVSRVFLSRWRYKKTLGNSLPKKHTNEGALVMKTSKIKATHFTVASTILKTVILIALIVMLAPANTARADTNKINASTYIMGVNDVLEVTTDYMTYRDSIQMWDWVKFTYKSSDESVAVIKNGEVRSKKVGKAVISQYINGKLKKKFTVNVTPFNYYFNGKTLTVAGYNSKSKLPTKLVIPDTVAGIKVTGISSHAFEKAKVDIVVLGSNITSIGESAFEECTATRITVKGSATIGKYAFISCEKLTNLDLQGKVTLEANAIAGCSKLKSLIFQTDATIGFNGLHYAEISELTFKGNTLIEGEAIIECEKLKRITFQGDATLKKNAIEDTVVEEITFSGKANLGVEAVSMCESLKQITFQDDAVLNKNAISLSDSLKSITFQGEAKLKSEAISSSGLETVMFLKKSYLEKGAFTDCFNLNTISFESNVEMEQYAFTDCALKVDIICDESKTVLRGNPFYSTFEADTDALILKLAYRHNQSMWLYSENTKKMYAKVVDCMSQVTASDSDFTKLKKIHDWMVNNLDYDYTFSNYSISDTLTYGTCVCNGYSLTYQMFVDFIGIPTEFIISAKMEHGWNQVFLDGNWYNVDVTWDDPTGHGLRYDYFLKSDAAIPDHYGHESMGCTSTLYDNYK